MHLHDASKIENGSKTVMSSSSPPSSRGRCPRRGECLPAARYSNCNSNPSSHDASASRRRAEISSRTCQNWEERETLTKRRAHTMRGRSWNWAVTVAHALFLLQVVRAQDPEPMPVGASAVLKLGNTSNSGAQAVSWTWGFRMLDPKTGRYNPYACNDKSDVHYSRGGEAIYHIECDPSTPGDC